MRKQDIDKLVTNEVAKYISNGYVINMNTFNSSDGTQRIDLIKDNHFIRLFLEKHYSYERYYIDFVISEMYIKNIKKFHERDIIYKDSLTKIYNSKFVHIGKDYYLPIEESKEVLEKSKQRRTERDRETDKKFFVKLDDIKAKKIVLPFVKRQDRCKSAKLSDIYYVAKIVDKNKVKYVVCVKDKLFYFK